MSNPTSTDYLSMQRLLERAELLYERHNVSNRGSFNVFSVLRSESDEVNLHSRFLVALLAHRNSEEAANLEDFIRFAPKPLKLDGARVERERDNIDILISNWKCKQAVVVENKIWATDQSRQLVRYVELLKEKGYQQIDVLYLTLDGHEPTKDSQGDLEVKLLSYQVDMIPWLERCQERAYDEPGLREAVGQYIDLVRKLTGTDVSGAYMKELKELVLKNRNMVLVHHLNEAMIAARVDLLGCLWKEIDEETRKSVKGIPSETKPSEVPSKEELEKFCRNSRGIYPGIRYQFESGASLVVETENHINFGLECSKKDHPSEYERLSRALAESPNSNDSWPWYQLEQRRINWKNPTIADLELLSDNQARKEYATEIAVDFADMWNRIRDRVLQFGAED